MEKKEDILSRVRKIMEYYGDNNQTFAERIQIDKSNLSKILKGQRTIGEGVVNKIVLNTKFRKDWILIGEGDPFTETEQTKTNEVTPVPEDDYMMIEFEDLETAAGRLGGGDIAVLPEKKKRLVPREYSKGNYLVVRVSGHSMDDNTKRSISEGEELLIKECYENDFNLPIRNKLFVIVTKEGSVVKQIKEINKEGGFIVCHSFNPLYDDYNVNFSEIIQIFTVEKKVKSNIIF